MDSRTEAAKAAVECTSEALRAIEQAHAHLDVAAEQLSKVPAMALERQRLSRLMKQVGWALHLVDDRRAGLRRRHALVLEKRVWVVKATAGAAERAERTGRR